MHFLGNGFLVNLAAFLIFTASAHSASHFVRIVDQRFYRGDSPYFFIGSNLWYGMNLGSAGESGNRARLTRELDQLRSLGVTNLRILATSEAQEKTQSPWRILPALHTGPNQFDESLLVGLDFLLHEMSKRKMTAVVVLGNFWPWSGGVAQYLEWSGAGQIPYPPPEPLGSWQRFQDYAAEFFTNKRAIARSWKTIERIVLRKNTLSGLDYRDDPTIMAWELANEPRGRAHVKAFREWIAATSHWIKSMDHNHLITTGSEGDTPWPESSGLDLIKDHSSPDIDYVTAHLWVENWEKYNPKGGDSEIHKAVDYFNTYFHSHLKKAETLGKPLVLEEFGLARDDRSLNPGSTTTHRDFFFSKVFEEVTRAAKLGRPIGGASFWAWSGEGRPRSLHWKRGQPFTGDPPHEPQGWYSVYDTDVSTHDIIRKANFKLKRLSQPNVRRKME